MFNPLIIQLYIFYISYNELWFFFQNSVPIELEVVEETTPGTKIGEVKAVDEDEGENAIINYAIIDGNDNKIFGIERGSNNQGILKIEGRLDR